jgi:hypothetical protein
MNSRVDPNPTDLSTGGGRLVFWSAALVVYVVLAIFGPVIAVLTGWVPAGLVSAANGGRGLGAAVWLIVFIAALMTVRYTVLGFLVAAAQRGSRRRMPGVGGAVGLVVLAGLTVAIAAAGDSGAMIAMPATDTLCLAGLFALAGWLIGAGWFAGKRGRRLTAWAVVGVVVLGGVALVMAGASALGREPIDVDMPRITSQEKRRLYNVVRWQRHRARAGDNIATIQLSDRDVRMLAAWAASVGPGDKALGVYLLEGGGSIDGYLRLPGGSKYLNFEATASIAAGPNQLDMAFHRLAIGKAEVPRAVLYLATPIVRRIATAGPLEQAVLSATIEGRIEPKGIALTYDRAAMPDDVAQQLAGDRTTDVTDEARLYAQHIIAVARTAPRGEGRLGHIIESTFTLARQRSTSDDAVRENRAAIYALAAVFGHPAIQRFTGPIVDDQADPRWHRQVGYPPLRGRGDWTRHLFLSAGLTLLSNEGVSDAVGLLKEELDAAIGGSGFSFADLAADRAGTRLAGVATRDAAAAAAVQSMLADDFRPALILPEIGDLPEGLRDADMEARFDGVGGVRFEQLVSDIERRLDACPALRQ